MCEELDKLVRDSRLSVQPPDVANERIASAAEPREVRVAVGVDGHHASENGLVQGGYRLDRTAKLNLHALLVRTWMPRARLQDKPKGDGDTYKGKQWECDTWEELKSYD